MKLKEIITHTGLTKKAIHFYIQQGLIHPNKEEESGYYIFTPEDEKTLQLISLLRSLGMSVESIKEAISQYPTSTNHILYKQVQLNKEMIAEKVLEVQRLNALIRQIPANATITSLLDYDLGTPTIPLELNSFLQGDDATLIAIALWGPFMGIDFNEYDNFLWSKLCSFIRHHYDNKYQTLAKLVFTITIPQLNDVCSRQARRVEHFLDHECNQSDLEEMKKALMTICTNQRLKNLFNEEYHSLLLPSMEFLFGDVRTMMETINPQYKKYLTKLNEICMICNQDQELMKKINECLHVKELNVAHLYIMSFFEDSIFTIMTNDEMALVLARK